jgi:hypothetical protein
MVAGEINGILKLRSLTESPFWFKNGTDHTPIPLFGNSVKQFQQNDFDNGADFRC